MSALVKIIGYLGQEPVLRFLESGRQVCNFSVATTHRWTGRDGVRHSDTAWFQVAAWGAMGANAHQYLAKGSLVMAIGELVVDPKTGGPRMYQKQNGEIASSLNLVARQVVFLSTPPRVSAQELMQTGNAPETSITDMPELETNVDDQKDPWDFVF